MTNENRCELYENRLKQEDVKRIDFVISNYPEGGDIPGYGMVVIDQVRGIKEIKPGSPWAIVEDMRQRALALELAAKSEQIRDQQLTKSVLLAVESIQIYPTSVGGLALRHGLDQLARHIATMPHEDSVNAVAFSPDGARVATASYDGTTKVWNATTGAEIATMPHEGSVNAVVFSPDGTRVATASSDGSAKVWNAATGAEIATMPHEYWVLAIAFSPDGTRVATASSDGSAKVWLWLPEDLINEACSRLTRNLTPKEWCQYLPGEPYCKTCPNLP